VIGRCRPPDQASSQVVHGEGQPLRVPEHVWLVLPEPEQLEQREHRVCSVAGDAVELLDSKITAEALHERGCPCIEGDHRVGQAFTIRTDGCKRLCECVHH